MEKETNSQPQGRELISVKSQVLKNPQLAAAHRKIVDDPQFEISVCYTLAELARMNLSAEQMHGANAFIDAFTLLAEKESTPQQFPIKKLLQ